MTDPPYQNVKAEYPQQVHTTLYLRDPVCRRFATWNFFRIPGFVTEFCWPDIISFSLNKFRSERVQVLGTEKNIDSTNSPQMIPRIDFLQILMSIFNKSY